MPQHHQPPIRGQTANRLIFLARCGLAAASLGNRDAMILSLLLWLLVKPTLLAADDQPLLCDCDASGPCSTCEPD